MSNSRSIVLFFLKKIVGVLVLLFLLFLAAMSCSRSDIVTDSVRPQGVFIPKKAFVKVMEGAWKVSGRCLVFFVFFGVLGVSLVFSGVYWCFWVLLGFSGGF